MSKDEERKTEEGLCPSCKHFMFREWDWSKSDQLQIEPGSITRCKEWGNL